MTLEHKSLQWFDTGTLVIITIWQRNTRHYHDVTLKHKLYHDESSPVWWWKGDKDTNTVGSSHHNFPSGPAIFSCNRSSLPHACSASYKKSCSPRWHVELMATWPRWQPHDQRINHKTKMTVTWSKWHNPMTKITHPHDLDDSHMTKMTQSHDQDDSHMTMRTAIGPRWQPQDQDDSHMTKVTATGPRWQPHDQRINHKTKMTQSHDQDDSHMTKVTTTGPSWQPQDQADSHRTKLTATGPSDMCGSWPQDQVERETTTALRGVWSSNLCSQKEMLSSSVREPPACRWGSCCTLRRVHWGVGESLKNCK